MDLSPPWLDRLKRLAASEAVPLEDLGPEGLEDLLALGLIEKDERPKQTSLESRYESLQETHRYILEARGCVERLKLRMAPRFSLTGLLHPSPPSPGPEDPDVARLFALLEQLKLQIRHVEAPEDVPERLDRIHDYLHVEGRECLDRLADTDREIDLLQKQAPPGTLVEPGNYIRLTPQGDAALPEAPVVEAFEAALQTAFGPLLRRGAGASHFREDPASLLAFLLEGMAGGARPSALMAEYESLLEAYERHAAFSEARSLRAKIAFIVRLHRAARDEPKRAYLWCNRERLVALLHRIRPLVPPSVAASGWHLPYAVDLFLAGGLQDDEEEAGRRTRLYDAVHRIQSDLLQDIRIGDGAFTRLALVLTHAARARNFAPGLLMDRFVRQALDTVMEASQASPYDLGDRGTRLLFGAHLAHAAGFAKTGLARPLEAFNALQERLRGDGPVTTFLPVQALLHAFATLDRLDRLGLPMPLDAYAGLLARLRKRLRHHKALSRAFRAGQAQAGDEAALASNLAALACFHGLTPPPEARHHPDAGMAGLYERRDPACPPLLGSPFGTLMLA